MYPGLLSPSTPQGERELQPHKHCSTYTNTCEYICTQTQIHTLCLLLSLSLMSMHTHTHKHTHTYIHIHIGAQTHNPYILTSPILLFWRTCITHKFRDLAMQNKNLATEAGTDSLCLTHTDKDRVAPDSAVRDAPVSGTV